MLICHQSFCLVVLKIQRPSAFEAHKITPGYTKKKINKSNTQLGAETIEEMVISFMHNRGIK